MLCLNFINNVTWDVKYSFGLFALNFSHVVPQFYVRVFFVLAFLHHYLFHTSLLHLDHPPHLQTKMQVFVWLV